MFIELIGIDKRKRITVSQDEISRAYADGENVTAVIFKDGTQRFSEEPYEAFRVRLVMVYGFDWETPSTEMNLEKARKVCLQ